MREREREVDRHFRYSTLEQHTYTQYPMTPILDDSLTFSHFGSGCYTNPIQFDTNEMNERIWDAISDE